MCLGAEGFWRVAGQRQPSHDHILDLSDVRPRNPRTNASAALAVIEAWPDDPSRFEVELVLVSDAHPCPCCGHLTLDEPPGSYSICSVCFWEDDAVQLRWPTYPGGANRPSLVEAQQAYIQHGAMERRFIQNVRPARTDEPNDDGWRVIDLRRDSFENALDKQSEWPDDLTALYWWGPTFWRGRKSP